MNFLMLVVLPVSIYVLAVIVLLGLDDRLLSLWRSWSGSVKRLILSMFLLFAFPLLAGTTGGCTVNYPHPTLWQAVKLLWNLAFGTCS